jgi:hypothetical protein
MTYDVQTMLTASGRDPVAVHELLTSRDAGGNLTFNDEFLGNVLAHPWTDGGTAAATMLTGVPATANMTDPADPTQLAMATRAGETSHAFAQYAANHPGELLNIAGTDNQSLGQLNPELTRALARATAPYVDDMIANPLDNTAGFANLDDPTKDVQLTNTRELFTVLGTDAIAADTINGQAAANALHYQANFEQSVIDGRAPEVGDLKSAGALTGLVEHSSTEAANDLIDYGNATAHSAYNNRQQWFDIGKDIAGEIPVVKGFLDAAGRVPGDPLQQLFVGGPPDVVAPAQSTMASSDLVQYQMTQRFVAENLGEAGPLSAYINPRSGSWYTLDEIVRKGMINDLQRDMANYFNGINDSIDSGVTDYETGYTGTVR